jgi:hypothetical protein
MLDIWTMSNILQEPYNKERATATVTAAENKGKGESGSRRSQGCSYGTGELGRGRSSRIFSKIL